MSRLVLCGGNFSADYVVNSLLSIPREPGWGVFYFIDRHLEKYASSHSCMADKMRLSEYAGLRVPLVLFYTGRINVFERKLSGISYVFCTTGDDVLDGMAKSSHSDTGKSLDDALSDVKDADCVLMNPGQAFIVRKKKGGKEKLFCHPAGDHIYVCTESLPNRYWQTWSNNQIMRVFPNGLFDRV